MSLCTMHIRHYAHMSLCTYEHYAAARTEKGVKTMKTEANTNLQPKRALKKRALSNNPHKVSIGNGAQTVHTSFYTVHRTVHVYFDGAQMRDKVERCKGYFYSFLCTVEMHVHRHVHRVKSMCTVMCTVSNLPIRVEHPFGSEKCSEESTYEVSL